MAGLSIACYTACSYKGRPSLSAKTPLVVCSVHLLEGAGENRGRPRLVAHGIAFCFGWNQR